jgi:hypothetical protein
VQGRALIHDPSGVVALGQVVAEVARAFHGEALGLRLIQERAQAGVVRNRQARQQLHACLCVDGAHHHAAGVAPHLGSRA